MCMLCIEIAKNKITFNEAWKAFQELNLENTDHKDELMGKIISLNEDEQIAPKEFNWEDISGSKK